MKKPKFTEGPWESGWVGEKPHGAAVVWLPTHDRVEVHTSNARANARLIASAPEMHALLVRLAHDDLGEDDFGGMVSVQTDMLITDAREILAKVEGEK